MQASKFHPAHLVVQADTWGHRCLDPVTAQEFSRRPHTAEVRFDPDPVIVGFMVAKVVLGQRFLRALQFHPLIIPPMHFLYHRHFTLFEIDCVVK